MARFAIIADGCRLYFPKLQHALTAPTVGYCLPTLPQPTVGAPYLAMNYNDQKAKFFARTMHTPDDEARAALRASLREVSRLLMPLHRAMIDAAKDDYAFAYGPVDQPTRLLGLLNEDPFFAWLKPVTSLIVDIDEMSRRDFETDEVKAIAARLEQFFGATPDPEFAKQYVPVLQKSVDVAVGHAALRNAIARLR